ncbi:uncharacterized protein LOC143263460, partial [Megalopta genalis]|uniref:uncharacterized protein LOC143263460 n=1 Tax=Megalopta genalis TaxID=115081 RepID=UPI003FD5A7BE
QCITRAPTPGFNQESQELSDEKFLPEATASREGSAYSFRAVQHHRSPATQQDNHAAVQHHCRTTEHPSAANRHRQQYQVSQPKVQTRIEILVAGTDAEAAHAIEREEFETAYFHLIDKVEIVIARATPEQSRITTNSPISAQTADTAINVRLPTLQLPSFDGNYSDWVKFKDTFTSVIHENNSLTDIQRFHYLNTSLKGVAACVIQALGMSGTNYRHAWELLKSRYEDSTSLKRHHVNSLLDLKSIQRESDITLREFLDEATNHRIALMSLGESVETWDTMLVPLLSRKLGQVSMREWERRIISQSEMPTFGQLSAFIEERSKYLANIAVSVQKKATRLQENQIRENPQYSQLTVLSDSGSQANFITTEFCKRLGIKPTAISSTVTGLGRAVNSIEGRATLTIHSRYNKSQHTIHREKIEIPSHIELADPEFHLQRPIDILIGAGLFWTLLCVGQHKSTSNLLLQKTQLGWVLGGTPTWADKKLSQDNKCCLATLNDLQSQLERFWDIEELTPSDTRLIDECEAHFRETIRRDTDGRYIVRIPFKSNANELVHPADRKYQRLLWRAQPHLPVQEYELNTVTYDTASAPFLATRTLHEIGLTCAHTFPTSSKKKEIETLKRELTQILSQAGMDLRKWASNCPTVTATDSTERNREIAVDKDPKTLGLLWSPTTDHLMFRVESPQNQRVTKRTILSEIAQIFDPLGLISPIVIVAKLILQQLWQTQIGWDQSIPQNLHSQWLQYRQDISKVGAMNISRCAISECLDDIELHGFSDASEKAYGACVYLRSRDLSGSWVTRLLCAKSRVAPLKTISLPRLELCGALLLANVVSKVRIALDTVRFKEYLWTDSTITLAWLRCSPNKWKTFVANRVSQIQGLTSSDSWRHVASEDNPADLISRGTKPGTLQNTTIWWDGPTWLRQSSSLWPSALDNPIDVPEEKERKPVMLTISTAESSIVRIFSTYTRLLRSIAYCLRFAKFMRNRVKKLEGDASGSLITGSLTTIEINAARTRLELLAQRQAFSTEIRLVQTQQALPNSSALRSLNVFLDNGGLLRVGGRLSNAPIDYDQKHPIILPPKHPLTDLIIKCEHHRLMHAGCQAVLTSLQTRCFKTNPLSQTYQMGQLPASRVTPVRRFFTCGVDYAGPFFTKERTRSKDKQHNEKIANALRQESIEWRLIPAHSPHFGGLWEGAVKSAKYHLTRVIGDQRLTFEELYTLLTQIESSLNSRPLSPLSSDPTDLNPLTPGHFLIGTALTTLPSDDLRDIKVTRLNRYQLIQQMVQHFWQRWQREGIQQLQQRHKWQHSTTSKLAVDSLVIIKEDNLPPLQWSMGRIVQ